MRGSDFAASLPPCTGACAELVRQIAARERALLDAVQAGDIIVDWTPLRIGELELEVSADAIRWGDVDDSVRMSCSCRLHQEIADELDAVLLTPRIADECWTQAHTRVLPHPQSICTASTAAALRHHEEIEAAALAAGWQRGELLVGWKDWCLHHRCWSGSRHAINSGWYVPQPDASGRWCGIRVYPAEYCAAWQIQPVAAAHDVSHVDYSQFPRIARRRARMRGIEVDLADCYTGKVPGAAELVVGRAGALPGARHPAVAGLST